MHDKSISTYTYPTGDYWATELSQNGAGQ